VTATETPPISADLSELCALVAARGKVPVADILTTGRDETLLAKALSKGYMVIGRQSYSEILADAKPRLKAGKQEFDPETKRPIVDRTVEIRLEKDWSWTGLPPGRKSLAELMEEEKSLAPDVPRLHVKRRFTE
jgi:hypothetical protein